MTTPTPPSENSSRTPPSSGPNNPSPTAELTALAAHLGRLANRVIDLEARCAELTDTLAGKVIPKLADISAAVAAELDEHTEQVQRLLDTSPASSARAVDWPVMNAEQAATAWNNLATWIADTLVPWYGITRDQLPDCWALHRPAVTQLGWLHHTYQAAHEPDAAPHLIAEWHTSWLPAALRAIRDAIPRRGARTCGPGYHLQTDIVRTRAQPGGPAPLHLRHEAGRMPTEQLAERGHWRHLYEQAVAADLAHRQSSS